MKNSFVTIDDFKCYAPSFLSDSSHFPKENFEELFELERGHFWFESRNEILLFLINHYLASSNNPKFLEIGCGTGFVLEAIAKHFPAYELSGTELYLEGLRFAKSRSSNIDFFQSDARDLPFKEKYDAIGAFDVIEHIEEDRDVLKSIHQNLKPRGFLFLSVPQHMWLWSDQDDYACHKRRYNRRELTEKLLSSGFIIKKMTSFVTMLLPLMYLSRKKATVKSHLDEFKISKTLNTLLTYIMKLDTCLIKAGFSLPVGGSLLCVAQKK